MEITNRMKELTQNILASSEERAKGLAKLKNEAHTLRQESIKTIKDFTTSRVETSRQLRKDLELGKNERMKEVLESRETAQNMIKESGDSRRKNGAQLRKDLAQGSKLLVQGEKKRKQQVGKMLDSFQNSRQESGTELKKELAEGKSKRITDVKGALADARTIIEGFESSRMKTGNELKDNLVKNNNKIKSSVEGDLKGFNKARSAVKADLQGASNAWQEMSSGISKKTSGIKVYEKVPETVPGELTPNLEEKLLSIINQHAEGITLSDAARELGLVTIVLGKAAKVLLDQNKVRRQQKVYFPANG
jgi:hypothetical protein